MQGFLSFLLGDKAEAKSLRQELKFKIIPMLNPDGVILGNYRTGIQGNDLNRLYARPDKNLYPIPYSLKKIIRNIKVYKKRKVLSYFDMHGHSKKKGVFMYTPNFCLNELNYYKIRIIPKMLS